MKLFFDTETSGKAFFDKPAEHDCQPRLVQLAAVLTTDDCEDISAINLLVRPDGWTIGEEAAKVHGISTEHAIANGLPVRAAVHIFVNMALVAASLHAFNIEFDRIIMTGEWARQKNIPSPFVRDHVCEMLAMKPICKLPGRFGDYKWPSLKQAYNHAYGTDFADAHDAMADVRAMIAVHKWRINQN